MSSRTASDFVTQAAMDNPKYPPVSLDKAIETAFDFAERIWRTPCHGTFVDHGVDHAFNDLRKARLLLEEVLAPFPSKKLSSLERCVLAMAALFHDIGMQWNNFAPASEKLPLADCRTRHVEKGMQMLAWALRGGNESVPTLAREKEFHDLFGYAGLVGFAHSGRQGWDKLVNDRVADDDWGPEGYPLRLKLLAAAFRLADEVDNSYNRITEFNRLCGETLDDETLAHWCACHFIHDVRIKTEGYDVVIDVSPRLPLSDPDSDADILSLLEEFRFRRMRDEEKLVRPFLGVEGRDLHAIQVRGGEAKRVEIESMPRRVRDYLHKWLETRDAERRASQPTVHAIELLSGSEHLNVARKELETADGAGRISKVGHFALRSGYHCDRYYYLDQLLGASSVDDAIVMGLKEHYCDREFTLVLGIGTTGSMLGARVAAALGVRFQYTATSTGYSGGGARSAPTAYERGIRLFPKERVLIIEDLMGYGTSLAEAVFRLRDSKYPPEYIAAFCLIVTTEAPANDEILKDIEIRALHHSRAVQYWPADDQGSCQVCRDGGTIAIMDE